MTMHRRRFLRLLTGSAAGIVLAPALDLDRLLWVPGERTIFLPCQPDLLVCEPWLEREALRILENKLRFTWRIIRDWNEPVVGHTFALRVGQSIQLDVNNPGRPDRFGAH